MNMVSMPTMIALDGVGRVFRRADGGVVEAVQAVSLAVPEGEFVCLVGPSGCGKSTLLQMIAGLLTPSSGLLRVGGVPVMGPVAGGVNCTPTQQLRQVPETLLEKAVLGG
jgi:NitT/TauT family transport system ATP-binding protein